MRFNSEFSITHLISIGGLIVVGFGAWGAFDKRVTVLEAAQITQSKIDQQQDADRMDMKRTNREDFKSINDKLDKILLVAQSRK